MGSAPLSSSQMPQENPSQVSMSASRGPHYPMALEMLSREKKAPTSSRARWKISIFESRKKIKIANCALEKIDADPSRFGDKKGKIKNVLLVDGLETCPYGQGCMHVTWALGKALDS